MGLQVLMGGRLLALDLHPFFSEISFDIYNETQHLLEEGARQSAVAGVCMVPLRIHFSIFCAGVPGFGSGTTVVHPTGIRVGRGGNPAP
jgi:hypothetical protein